MTEDNLQATCYQWAYNHCPIVRGVFFSVPNGGTRNFFEAQKLKATGLTPGIPDMILIYNGVHGFEFKTQHGRLSDSQRKIHTIWEGRGIPVHVISDVDVFISIFQSIIGNTCP